MIARLLISTSINQIKESIGEAVNLPINHPDVLYFEAGKKLGIGEARKIKEHFSLKPYSAKGRLVIMEDTSVMTHEAQNALLKTLEEPPEGAILILGAPSEANLLPTILSRCQIVVLTEHSEYNNYNIYNDYIKKLINSGIEDRFEYIANLKEKEEFLHALTYFFRQQLINREVTKKTIVQNVTMAEIKDFLKELLQAEEWAKQNVNIRGILEYLMLKMPKTS